VTLLKRVGYHPNALVDMLKVMDQSLFPVVWTLPKPPFAQRPYQQDQQSIGAYAESISSQDRFDSSALGNV
jgi:hypothetical protein